MDNILAAVHEILVAEGKPLHFQEILRRLHAAGVIDDIKAMDPTVYGRLYQDVKKFGDKSRFVKMPRAWWIANEHYNPDKHNVAPPGAVQRQSVEKLAQKAVEDSRPKRCGGCEFIRYTGINEVTMASGQCMSERSGRCGVRSSEDACEFFHPRSDGKRDREVGRANELRILVAGVNVVAQKRGHRG